jgi:hypothetical protein
MTSARLKDQLQVYCDVLRDPVLVKTLWKNMTTVAVCKQMVLDARERELARRYITNFSINGWFQFVSGCYPLNQKPQKQIL